MLHVLEGCGRGLKRGKKKELNTKPTEQYQGGTGLILTKRTPPPPMDPLTNRGSLSKVTL